MATLPHPVVEFCWDTLTTTLATNTTLGTATRNDFTAITLYVPEASPTFLSAEIVVTWRNSGTIQNWTGTRLGIKLGAVAFDDVDYTPSAISVFTANAFEVKRDVTAYFVSNWSGTSMTAQVGVAVATATATTITNVTARIRLTYSYDDASTTTRIKTVWIPIQGAPGLLTNSQVEIGTTGGANDAPANQIPLLDTFLPEASKTIRQAFFVIEGPDSRASTSSFNLNVQIDSAAAYTRATITGTSGGTNYEDLLIYDTATFATSAAHAFKADGSVTGRFAGLCAVLVVTYEYDPSTTTRAIQSVLLPIPARLTPLFTDGTATADADAYQITLWVEEPGTITLVQSGLLLRSGPSTGSTLVTWAGGQAERTTTYTTQANNPQTMLQRCDQGTSPWALVRGKNTLTWHAYAGTAQATGIYGGFAIINYTSDVSAQGIGRHQGTYSWAMFDQPTTGTVTGQREIAAASQKFPTLPAHWFLNSIGTEVLFDAPAVISGGVPLVNSFELKRSSGEGPGGWLVIEKGLSAGNAAARPPTPFNCTYELLEFFNRTDQATGLMDPTASRKTRIQQNTGYTGMRWWLTFHGLTFTVSGTLTGYTGDGSGITVNIHTNLDDSMVATVVSTAGGGYTTTVYDSANTHYSEAYQDGTHLGRSDNLTPS